MANKLRKSHTDDLLGEVLIQQQLITRDQLTIALHEQRQSGRLLGEELLSLGFIEENLLLSILALRFNLPVLIDRLHNVDTTALLCVSEENIRQYQLFPVALDQATQHLTIAVSVPQDASLLNQLSQSYKLTLLLTSYRVIEQALYQHFLQGALTQLTEALEWGEQAPEDTSIMIRFVDALLADALQLRASDLHCEPETAWVNLRYRIDGVLVLVKRLHRCHWSALSVRLKLMAGLDIAETRASQDGRIVFPFAAREVDCRVSVVPTLHGENIVIRFLDRAAQVFTLTYLGFSTTQQQTITRILRRPYGITLVVGPTGSGKTTTLYTLLQQFDRQHHNIMTLEDPVEYGLPGIRQIAMHTLVKMDFASAIRAILRQAPDIILVGEIRDRETATAVFQAGMTGHRVFASVHAKSVVGAIGRLSELGVANTHIAANVVGVIAQRLVRRLCQYCKVPVQRDCAEGGYWQAAGCIQCGHRGFKGRVVLAEVRYIDATLAARIEAACVEVQTDHQHTPSASFADDAHDKLKAGVTSQSEILRVLDPEQEGRHAV